MFTLRAENERGEQITLSQNPKYVIESIDGLNPPDAVLNLYKQAGADGMRYNSATLDARQIIITLAVNGPAEANRTDLYRCFQTKKAVRIFYSNGVYDVYADGHVQNLTVGYFEIKQIVQIVVICSDPYFHLVTPTVTYYNGVEDALFEFPFAIPEEGIPFSETNTTHMATIINAGNIDTGIHFKLMASGAVVNPVITHAESGAFFGLTTSMQSGDVIEIDTRAGHKEVYRVRAGVKTSLISSRNSGSEWIQAVPGLNTFSFSASSGLSDLSAEISIIGDIEGV